MYKAQSLPFIVSKNWDRVIALSIGVLSYWQYEKSHEFEDGHRLHQLIYNKASSMVGQTKAKSEEQN